MIVSIGALHQWREELRAGLRTRYDFDALFRAACKEAQAAEHAREGCLLIADQLRLEAARIIVAAASEEAAA